jgi:hypothetical protein
VPGRGVSLAYQLHALAVTTSAGPLVPHSMTYVLHLELAQTVLDEVSITLNKNSVPGDKSAIVPGGIRIGTPALTTRGFKEAEFVNVADFIHRGVQVRLRLVCGMGEKGGVAVPASPVAYLFSCLEWTWQLCTALGVGTHLCTLCSMPCLPIARLCATHHADCQGLCGQDACPGQAQGV